MPQKMSKEKQLMIEALGATIVRTPTEAAHDSPESNFGVAIRLQKEIPNAHILDQWANADNQAAHYEGTAEELLQQTGGKMDAFVGGVGTGGTISGAGHKLKERLPKIKIVAADPEGSIIGGGEPGGPYLVEGIGYDFIPQTMDVSIVDRFVKTNDRTSFELARRLIKEEALLVGGSSGSAMQAAIEVAKDGPGQTIVVLLPDSIRNYMSKFLDPTWLSEHDLDSAI